MWYLQYVRAREIAAQRAREAELERLARTARDGGDDDGAPRPGAQWDASAPRSPVWLRARADILTRRLGAALDRGPAATGSVGRVSPINGDCEPGPV